MGQTVAFRRLPLGGNALLLAVVIAIEIPIVITVVVPAVVVGHLAALPFPIAGKILLAIMMRFHPNARRYTPDGSNIRRAICSGCPPGTNSRLSRNNLRQDFVVAL